MIQRKVSWHYGTQRTVALQIKLGFVQSTSEMRFIQNKHSDRIGCTYANRLIPRTIRVQENKLVWRTSTTTTHSSINVLPKQGKSQQSSDADTKASNWRKLLVLKKSGSIHGVKTLSGNLQWKEDSRCDATLGGGAMLCTRLATFVCV